MRFPWLATFSLPETLLAKTDQDWHKTLPESQWGSGLTVTSLAPLATSESLQCDQNWHQSFAFTKWPQRFADDCAERS
jgi:hypothetical protein